MYNHRVVMFGVDWCQHCASTEPKFKEARSIAGPGVFKYVNAESQQGISLASKYSEAGYKINGYPAIYGRTSSGNTVRYTGDRSVQSFLAFAENLMLA